MKRLAAFILIAGLIQATSWGDELWKRPRSLFSSSPQAPFQTPVFPDSPTPAAPATSAPAPTKSTVSPVSAASAEPARPLPPRPLFPSTVSAGSGAARGGVVGSRTGATAGAFMPPRSVFSAAEVVTVKPVTPASQAATSATGGGIANAAFMPPRSLFSSDSTVPTRSFDYAAGSVTAPPAGVVANATFMPPKSTFSANAGSAVVMSAPRPGPVVTDGDFGSIPANAIVNAGFMPPRTLLTAISGETAITPAGMFTQPSTLVVAGPTYPARVAGVGAAYTSTGNTAAAYLSPQPLFSRTREVSTQGGLFTARTPHPEIDPVPSRVSVAPVQATRYAPTPVYAPAPIYTPAPVAYQQTVRTVAYAPGTLVPMGAALPLPTGYRMTGSQTTYAATGNTAPAYDAFDPASVGPFCGYSNRGSSCGGFGNRDRNLLDRFTGWLCYHPSAGDALPKLRPHPYVGPVIAFRCDSAGACGNSGCGPGGAACAQAPTVRPGKHLNAALNAPCRPLLGSEDCGPAGCRSNRCVPPSDDAFPGYKFASVPNQGTMFGQPQTSPAYTTYKPAEQLPQQVVPASGDAMARPFTRP